MAVRNIFQEGEPVLRKKAKPVVEFDKKLSDFIDDLKETLLYNDGAGLAANQVGILKQVCLININERYVELVNPIIIKKSKKTEACEEGCLSVKDANGNLLYDIVERPKKVTVKYQDRKGLFHTEEFEGYVARAACHEIDHLNGTLYIDLVKKR